MCLLLSLFVFLLGGCVDGVDVAGAFVVFVGVVVAATDADDDRAVAVGCVDVAAGVGVVVGGGSVGVVMCGVDVAAAAVVIAVVDDVVVCGVVVMCVDVALVVVGGVGVAAVAAVAVGVVVELYIIYLNCCCTDRPHPKVGPL